MLVDKIKLVVIVGPSAIGKTRLSIKIAKKLDAEIISADSTLFYRGMDIGTAKPTKSEQEEVRHHLIDILDPKQQYSLAEFQRDFKMVIADIHDRNKKPILVGGSGQYVHAILDGWEIPRVKPDPGLRFVLENWLVDIGNNGLHRRLSVLDNQAAENIDPRNSRRIIRAIEVIFHTGNRYSEQRISNKPEYHTKVYGLHTSREELYKRVDGRIEKMIDDGLIEEVNNLLEKGYDPNLPVFNAIGYREIIQYLQGDIDLSEAKRLMRKRTRVFIRHQANWFKRNDSKIIWFSLDESNHIQDKIVSEILQWYRC